MEKITIIGGGPAGLSTAFFLKEKGFKAEVFEASKYVGGSSSSIKLWGDDYDLGPHSFPDTVSEKAKDLWLKYGKEVKKFQLKRGMFRGGQLLHFPPSKGELLVFEPVLFIRSGLSFLFRDKSRSVSDSYDLFEKNYGSYLTKKVFEPYCKKYMGHSSKELDMRFAESLTSFKERRDDNEVPVPSVLYPAGGVGQVWNNLADDLKKRNCPVNLSKTLRKLHVTGRKIATADFEGGLSVELESLVSAIPIRSLLNALNNVPDEVKNAADALRMRSTILVYLKTKDIKIPYHYITVFDDSLKAGRVTNFSEWKGNDNGVLCFEFWCDSNDELWNLNEDDLVDMAERDLVKLASINDKSIDDYHVVKLPSSYPVPDTQSQSKMELINKYLSSFENLHVLGRHSQFELYGQDNDIDAAYELSEKMKVTA